MNRPKAAACPRAAGAPRSPLPVCGERARVRGRRFLEDRCRGEIDDSHSFSSGDPPPQPPPRNGGGGAEGGERHLSGTLREQGGEEESRGVLPTTPGGGGRGVGGPTAPC